MTIKTSLHELGMFFFFLVVAMVIFSSAAYYAEAGQADTQLTSIPADVDPRRVLVGDCDHDDRGLRRRPWTKSSAFCRN